MGSKSRRKSTDAITEELHTYPAGRGKALIIAVKRRLPKKQRRASNPRFTHARIKSNPDDICLVEYLNNDIKRVILFPENRQLSYEERLDLAASLLITLPKTIGKRYKGKFPSFLTREVGATCKRKWLRYQKFRNKNQ